MGFGREESILGCISPSFGVPLESSKEKERKKCSKGGLVDVFKKSRLGNSSTSFLVNYLCVRKNILTQPPFLLAMLLFWL